MYRFPTTTAAAVLAALLFLDSSLTTSAAYNPSNLRPKQQATAPVVVKTINSQSPHRNRNLHVQPSDLVMPRRAAVQGLLVGALGIATAFRSNIRPSSAAAADTSITPDTTLQDVYFGVGCYWHIQHEFVTAELERLGRSNQELTAYTGYAGGKSTDKEGRVCYHNLLGVADYGKLGHGEVVGMTLPADRIVEFSALYFSLFNPKTKGTKASNRKCCTCCTVRAVPWNQGFPSRLPRAIDKEVVSFGVSFVSLTCVRACKCNHFSDSPITCFYLLLLFCFHSSYEQ
jgi:hypothetical protein